MTDTTFLTPLPISLCLNGPAGCEEEEEVVVEEGRWRITRRLVWKGKEGSFFFLSVTQRFISANPSYISVGKLEQ